MGPARTFRRALVIGTSSVAAFACPSLSARAEGEEAIVVQVDGEVPCSNAEDFFDRVHRRAPGGRRARDGEPGRKFTFGVAGAPPVTRGYLIIEREKGDATRREVTGESCLEVVDALALITAIDIDPRAADVLKLPTVTPDVTPIEPLPPPPEPPEPPPRWEMLAGGGFSLSGGVAPVPLAAIPVRFELRRAALSRSPSIMSPAVTISFERTFNSVATGTSPEQRSGDVSFYVAQMRVSACPIAVANHRLRLGPCVNFEAGALVGEGKPGKSLASTRPDRRAWFAAGLSGRATTKLWDPIYLDIEGAIGWPLVRRYEFQLDPNIPLGNVAGWNWRFGLAVEVRFL